MNLWGAINSNFIQPAEQRLDGIVNAVKNSPINPSVAAKQVAQQVSQQAPRVINTIQQAASPQVQAQVYKNSFQNAGRIGLGIANSAYQNSPFAPAVQSFQNIGKTPTMPTPAPILKGAYENSPLYPVVQSLQNIKNPQQGIKNINQRNVGYLQGAAQTGLGLLNAANQLSPNNVKNMNAKTLAPANKWANNTQGAGKSAAVEGQVGANMLLLGGLNWAVNGSGAAVDAGGKTITFNNDELNNFLGQGVSTGDPEKDAILKTLSGEERAALVKSANPTLSVPNVGEPTPIAGQLEEGQKPGFLDYLKSTQGSANPEQAGSDITKAASDVASNIANNVDAGTAAEAAAINSIPVKGGQIDKTLYHGTASQFDQFKNDMRGSTTGAQSAKDAFWLTDNKDVAKAYSIYAAEDGPVNQLMRQQDAAEKIAKSTGDWTKYDDLTKQIEDVASYDKTFERRKLANVKEVVAKGDFYQVDAHGKSPQELSVDDNIDSWLTAQVNKAKSMGKDGIVIKNLDDGIGLYDKPSTHYGIFDANNISLGAVKGGVEPTVPIKSTTPAKVQPPTPTPLTVKVPSAQTPTPSVLKAKTPATKSTVSLTSSEKPLPQTPTPEFLQKSPSGSIIPQPNTGIIPTAEETQKMVDLANYAADNKAEIQKGLAKWLGDKKIAKIQGAQFVQGTTKIPNKLNWDVIRGLEGKTDINPTAKAYLPEQRANYQQLLTKLNQSGLAKTDVQAIQNYAFHQWKETPAQIDKAITKAGMSQRVPMQNGRRVPTYDQGIEMGLTPAETNANALQGKYVERVQTAIANKSFFDNFVKKNNLAIPASVGINTPGFEPYNVPGFPKSVATVGEGKQVIGNYYGPKSFVKQIDQILAPKGVGSMDTLPKKALYYAGKTNVNLQHLLFTGTGIPGTPINAMGLMGIVQKGVLEGQPIRAVKALVLSSGGDKVFNNWLANGANGAGGTHLDSVKELLQHDVNITTPYNINHMVDNGLIKNVFGQNVPEAWSKVTHEPTFARLQLAMQIQMYEGEKALALKAGANEAQAQQIAADTVKNGFGSGTLVQKASESQLAKSTKASIFFGPTYRATMVNWWGNLVKSLGAPLKPENKYGIRAIIGIITAAVAYNEINKKNTGHDMWDNPTGYQNKMIINLGGDKHIAIPFLPTIGTVPTLAITGALDLINGDIKGFGAQVAGLSSRGIQIASQVGSNMDFWGDSIYQGTDSTATRYIKDVGYVIKQLEPGMTQVASNLIAGKLPPEVSQFMGAKNQPWYQNLTQEMGSTVKYPSTSSLQTSQYYGIYGKIYNQQNTETKSALDLLHPSAKDPQTGQYVLKPTVWDSSEKANIYLANPAALKADTQINLQLQQSGQKIDPFFNLTPAQQQTVLTYATLNTGDPQKDFIENHNSWMPSYQNQRTAFFNSLPPANPDKPGAPIPYPTATPQVTNLMNQYYALTDGTAKNNFINAHPDVQAQMDKQTQYANDVLKAKGLAAMKSYPTATPAVQSFTTNYLSSSKAQRTAIRNANPQAYQNMIAYFDSTDLYNIGKEGAASQLVGNPDSTSKENKAISNVAQDIYQNPDGTYSVVPAGWMQGLSNSSSYLSKYGSGGTKKTTAKMVTVKKEGISGKIPTLKPIKITAGGQVGTKGLKGITNPRIPTIKLAKLPKTRTITLGTTPKPSKRSKLLA